MEQKATKQPDEFYSISELADAAQVTPRTIRYYTSEGLLPPPDVQAKYARYTSEHLQRLRLIGQLKAAYLPLHEIRLRLAALDSAQVATALADAIGQQAAATQAAEQSSASAYIADVLARQQRLGLSSFAPTSAAPPSPAAAPPLVQRAAPQQRSVAEQSAASANKASATWQRIPLAPGVELHVQIPVPAAMQTLVEQTLQLFANDDT